MKILAVIVNYGSKNDRYLRRLIDEYRTMSHNMHIVVLSNVPKTLDGVEVVVETPRGDPLSFPFAHKKILAERLDSYDLFIYSEDDTLITQKNVDAFVRVSRALPGGEIAGFLRSEQGADGTRYISTVHGHFHWAPHSVVSRGEYTFAHFTNEHSAAYILSHAQLARAIHSGGFLVKPHGNRYGLQETAATDPYTKCGFKKMICISGIDDFILPHLPNKYVGKLGLPAPEFRRQLQALGSIQNHTRPRTILLNNETKVGLARWSKSYYEPSSSEVLNLIPAGARRVLSYGCGWGAMEEELMRRGMRVTAVALDSVVGICAEARGVEVIYGDAESALSRLSAERFDCIVLSNVLHLMPAPEQFLSALARLLNPGGAVVATVPNLAQLPVRWLRVRRDPAFMNLGSYELTGTHVTSYKKVREWFHRAGLRVPTIVPVIPRRAQWVRRFTGFLFDGLLAAEFSVLGVRAS
ncbi:MAG: class I SAM-dependent methyltransferase [Bryobacteraceae bacterium]